MAPTLSPTTGFLRRIHSRRHHPIAAPPKPPQIDKLWTRISGAWGKRKKWWTPGFDGEGELVELAKKAAALLAGKFPTAFERDVFAAAERIVGFDATNEVSLVWIAHSLAGPRAALEMEIGALALHQAHTQIKGGWCHTLERKPAQFVGSRSFVAVRDLVCQIPDAEYAEARAFAAEVRPKLEPMPAAAVAFFFPDEPWADEEIRAILADPQPQTRAWYISQILASCKDRALADAFITLLPYQGYTYVPDLALGLPLDQVPDFLVELATRAEASKTVGNAEWIALSETLATVIDERCSAVLGRLLLHKFAGPAAVAHFRAHPELAQKVLPPVAAGKNKAAEAARAILEAGSRRAATEDVAPPEDLPAILREPPWRVKKKIQKRAVLALTLLAFEEKIAWEPGEREKEAKADHVRGEARPMTPDELAAYDALPEPKHVDVWPRWENQKFHQLIVPTDRGLPRWNTEPKSHCNRGLLHVLARYGEAAIPGMLLRDPFAFGYVGYFVEMTRVESPQVAHVASRAMQRKPYRRFAQAYFERFPEVSALALLPVAFGEPSKEQRAAEDVLRYMDQKGKREVLRAVAARYGEGATAELDAFLARDPLSLLEPKGAVPEWLQPDELPRVRTKKGQVLGPEATAALVDVLRGTELDPAYPGIALLREALDLASLADFAWSLFVAWNLAGAKTIHAWAVHALAHFGDEGTARRFAPVASEWGRKDAKKAILAVQVLAALGTDGALLHLGNLADKARFAPAREAAKEALSAIAAARGLSLEELSDRTVPTLDLDADGSATLDFGARTFRVVFDETLTPIVVAQDGTRSKVLARANAADDKAKAKAATERFKQLKTDVAAVAANQIRRFERAMIQGRRWPFADFDALVAKHPLLVHLVRRVVWGVFDGDALGVTFRVAEDGTLSDADDRALTVSGSVGIVHPLLLTKELREGWARVFGDYEILQPFEQLGRALHTLDANELATGTSTIVAGADAKPGAILGTLESRGWERTLDSWITSHTRAVRLRSGEEAHVLLQYTPGIALEDVAGSAMQTLKELTIQGAKLGDVTPIDLSEVLRDLEALRR